MTIIAQAEKKQVVRINWLATLAGHETESVLILLCRNLRVNFAAHPQNRFFRNRSRRQKTFPSHPEVALLIVGWHAALVAKRDTNRVPWQVMSDGRNPGINRPRSVPAGEGNPEFVAFAKSFVRLFENEAGGVSDEIFRSNDLRFSFHTAVS